MQLVPVEVEDFDDICIILIEFFGAYSVLEELQSRCMELHGACKGCRLQGECMELHVACKDNPFLLRGSVEDCNKKQ